MKEVLLNDGNLADIARLRSRWVMMEASKMLVRDTFEILSDELLTDEDDD